MTYKEPSARFYSLAHNRTQSSIYSFLRDGTVFAYLIFAFTANIDLIYISGHMLTAESASKEGSLFSQITISVLLGISTLLQFANKTSLRQVIITGAPLVLVLIWILLSVTWSEFEMVSLRRAIRLLMETATILMLAATYRDLYKLLRVIYFSFAFILLADVVFLSMPDRSFSPIGYAGVHYSKQTTGSFCLLALPVFLLAVFDRNIFPIRTISFVFFLGSLAFLAISLSKSAQGLAPICIILTILVIFSRRVNPIILVLIYVSIAVITAAIIGLVGLDNALLNVIGDTTFTGRTGIWDYALSLFWQSPIIGRGYGGIWNVGSYSILLLPDLSESTFVLDSSHSGYIDVMAALGSVGLLFTIFFIISTFVRLGRQIPIANFRQTNFIAIYTFIAFFLDNFLESSLFRTGSGFWIYFLLVTYASFFSFQSDRIKRRGGRGIHEDWRHAVVVPAGQHINWARKRRLSTRACFAATKPGPKD